MFFFIHEYEILIYFRFETVSKLLSNSFQKQLANIRKTQERKKRDTAADKHSSKNKNEHGDVDLLTGVRRSQPERYAPRYSM